MIAECLAPSGASRILMQSAGIMGGKRRFYGHPQLSIGKKQLCCRPLAPRLD
jgi:hypothetical protein